MALIKKIELDNGVITNYHRIVKIDTIVNSQTIIEVSSYTSEEKREEEKTATLNSTEMNVYIETSFYNMEYNENNSVKSAYEYLKELEEFKDSEDV